MSFGVKMEISNVYVKGPKHSYFFFTEQSLIFDKEYLSKNKQAARDWKTKLRIKFENDLIETFKIPIRDADKDTLKEGFAYCLGKMTPEFWASYTNIFHKKAAKKYFIKTYGQYGLYLIRQGINYFFVNGLAFELYHYRDYKFNKIWEY